MSLLSRPVAQSFLARFGELGTESRVRSTTYPDVLLSLRLEGRETRSARLRPWRSSQAVDVRERGGGARSEQNQLDGVVGERGFYRGGAHGGRRCLYR